jgi:hypothetical protein
MGNWRGSVGEDEGAMGRRFRSLEGEGVVGNRGRGRVQGGSEVEGDADQWVPSVSKKKQGEKGGRGILGCCWAGLAPGLA